MPLKVIKIPCKKYIAKYLCTKYEANHDKHIVIKRNSNLALYMKTLLSSNYKREEKRRKIEQYDFEVSFLVNSGIFRHGYRLSKASIVSFNIYMRNKIFEEFRNKVMENIGNGESKENLAIEFLNQYNITEDELSVDTILRDERRNNSQIN